MSDVILFRPKISPPPRPMVVQSIPITTLDEHSCTRQARILHAWLLDSAEDHEVGLDWTIERLKQALQWAEMRKCFLK